MKRIFLLALFLQITDVFCQTVLSGKITPSETFDNKLYILKYNQIDPHPPVVYDSIVIDAKGEFSYRFNNDSPQDLIYKIFLPLKEGNPFHTFGTINKNYFYLTTESPEKVIVSAHADSLFYSLKIKGTGLNAQLLKFRDLHSKLYVIERTYMDSISLHPDKEQEYKQRAMPAFIRLVDNVRKITSAALDTATNASVILFGILNLYEANFGKIDSASTSKYLKRIKNRDLLIVRNIQKLASKTSSNRIGLVLPDVTLHNTIDKTEQLYNIEEEYVVVNFWASWCSPCRYANKNELPAFYNKYKGKVSVLGISVDEDLQKWKKAVEKDNTSWKQVMDKSYLLKKTLEVDAVPVYLLLDKNHIIIFESLSVYQMDEFLQKQLRVKSDGKITK